MHANPDACPACGHPSTEPLVDLGEVPRSGLLLRVPADPVPQHHLRYKYCPCCALIRQRAAQDTPVDYSLVDRSTTRQIPDYLPHILASLTEGLVDPSNDLIIEVGANDGEFLDRLQESGWRKRLGIEPSKALAAQARDKGHDMVNVHLTPESAQTILASHGPAAAVICRHTLEHVPSPADLVSAMRRLLKPTGKLFIEVPSSALLLQRLQVYELWDEHLSVFSSGSLSRLVVASGLQVTRLEELAHRDGANLLLWARPGAGSSSVALSEIAANLAGCASLSEAWTTYSVELRRRATSWRSPVLAMGASHPQSNFLQYARLGHLVSALIDDDSRKVGRYVPLPQPTPVISSEQALASATRGGTLLLTAFGYPAWTARLRSAFTARGFECIDPYETVSTSALPA